jgi:TRAP-type uncharacterized transport system substrate-binding protein
MRTRRDCLRFLAIGGGAFWLSGHAPYRQWVVYRSERLMIVASRREPEAFPLAEALAADLQRAIPDARPEAARAPTVLHVSRLVLSRQIDVAVLTADQARAVSRGEGESAAEGPVPLRILAFLREPFVLACHADFDRDKAYLLVFGLFDAEGSPTLAPAYRSLEAASRGAAGLGIPLHVGARQFYLELNGNSPG